MEILNKNIIRIIKLWKVMEYFNGMMENFILENLKINIFMEMVLYIFLMVMLFKANGFKDIMFKYIKNIKFLKVKEINDVNNVYRMKIHNL